MSQQNPNNLLENLRKVITLVDQLRDIGLSDYIKLPRIVVLGIQSSGKSSLLEQIVGIDFLPRGDGVVTRRPLELRLSYVNKIACPQPYAVFEEIKDKKFTDFNQVKENIIALTDKIAGTSKNIVDKPIILQVFGPNCPDLTLVDLPGITRIAIAGQDSNIEEVTKNMARKYCEDPKTIILCVVAANQDLSTSDAIQMAQKLDPEGIRTFGVLTKIDIMDRGTDAVRMLKGQDVALRLGYVGVKLRSNQDIKDNLNVQTAIQQEREFFAKHPVYSSIPGDLFGTQVLTTKLTNLLYRHIRSFLPELMKEINRRATDLEDRLLKLGPGLPVDDRDKLHYIWQLINEFSLRFRNSISGSYQKNALQTKVKIPAGSRIREQFTDFLYEEQKQNYKALKNYTDFEIQQIIYKYEGDNIPGFLSVDAFYALLNPELKKIKRPAQQCVEEVYVILEEYAVNILEDQLSKIPSIKDLLQEQVLKIIRNCKENSLNAVFELLDAEVSYIFTNDINFLTGKPFDPSQDPSKSYDPKSNPLVNELRRKIEHYYQLVIRTVRDNVPKLIGHFLVRECQNVMLLELQENLMQNPEYLDVVNEPQHIVQERKSLGREVEVLKNAQKIIKRDPDLSEYILKISQQDENEGSEEKIETVTVKQQQPPVQQKQQVQVQINQVTPPPSQQPPQPVINNQPQPQQQQNQNTISQQQSGEKKTLFGNKPQPNISAQPQTQTQPYSNPNQNTQQSTNPLSRNSFFKPIYYQDKQAQNTNPLNNPKPQPAPGLKDQYNSAVDKGVDQVMASQQTQNALAQGARQGAAAAVQQNLPGAPPIVTKYAQDAAEAAIKSDTAQNAIKDQMKQQLKDPITGGDVVSQPQPEKKSLFGFIGKK